MCDAVVCTATQRRQIKRLVASHFTTALRAIFLPTHCHGTGFKIHSGAGAVHLSLLARQLLFLP
jgi:hypothetical protein